MNVFDMRSFQTQGRAIFDGTQSRWTLSGLHGWTLEEVGTDHPERLSVKVVFMEALDENYDLQLTPLSFGATPSGVRCRDLEPNGFTVELDSRPGGGQKADCSTPTKPSTESSR